MDIMLTISHVRKANHPGTEVSSAVSTRPSPNQPRYQQRLQQQQHQQPVSQNESEREQDLSVLQLLHASPLLVQPAATTTVVQPDSPGKDGSNEPNGDSGSALMRNGVFQLDKKAKRSRATRQLPMTSKSSSDLADLPVVELKPFTSTVWRPARSYSATGGNARRFNEHGSTATREEDGIGSARRKVITVDVSLTRASTTLVPPTSHPLTGKGGSNNGGGISPGITSRPVIEVRSRRPAQGTPETDNDDSVAASGAGPSVPSEKQSIVDAMHCSSSTVSTSPELTVTNGTSRNEDIPDQRLHLHQPTIGLVAVGSSQHPLPPRTQRATPQRGRDAATGTTLNENAMVDEFAEAPTDLTKSTGSPVMKTLSRATDAVRSTTANIERSRTLPLIGARSDVRRRRPYTKTSNHHGLSRQQQQQPHAEHDPWSFEIDRTNHVFDKQRGAITARRRVTTAATGIEIQVFEQFVSTLERLRRTRTTRAVADGFGRSVPRQCDIVAKPTNGEARLMSAARRNRRPPKRTNWSAVLSSQKKATAHLDLFHLPRFFSFENIHNCEDATICKPTGTNSLTVESAAGEVRTITPEEERGCKKSYRYSTEPLRHPTPVCQPAAIARTEDDAVDDASAKEAASDVTENCVELPAANHPANASSSYTFSTRFDAAGEHLGYTQLERAFNTAPSSRDPRAVDVTALEGLVEQQSRGDVPEVSTHYDVPIRRVEAVARDIEAPRQIVVKGSVASVDKDFTSAVTGRDPSIVDFELAKSADSDDKDRGLPSPVIKTTVFVTESDALESSFQYR